MGRTVRILAVARSFSSKSARVAKSSQRCHKGEARAQSPSSSAGIGKGGSQLGSRAAASGSDHGDPGRPQLPRRPRPQVGCVHVPPSRNHDMDGFLHRLSKNTMISPKQERVRLRIRPTTAS